MKHVVVIGAGVAGLATACLLRDHAHVTLIEKNSEVGGRVGRISSDGFVWDTGPSWLLMRDAFEHFYQQLGTSLAAELDLVPLDPAYRVFHEGYAPVDVRSGVHNVVELFESISPGEGEKITTYLDSAAQAYQMAMRFFLYTTFSSIRPFVSWPLLSRLWTLQKLLLGSLKNFVEKDFRHPITQKILQYPAVFLATDPARTPAMYHLLSHTDLEQGVFYPRGGFGTLVDSLQRLAVARGVSIRCGTSVTGVATAPGGGGGDKHQVTGVRVRATQGGAADFIAADAVVSAADVHHTDTQLVPPELRGFSQRHWRTADPGIGAVVALLGVRGQLPQLSHHQLLLSDGWEGDFRAIHHTTLGVSQSIYVCKPSETDATVAPEGHENLFVLIPTSANPALGHGSAFGEETPRVGALVDAALETISARCDIPDLRQRIVARHTIGPGDFADIFHSWRGSALGPAHTLRQSAFLRAGQRSRTIDGLFYAGGTTAPGIGLPMCLISAHNAAELTAAHLAR